MMKEFTIGASHTINLGHYESLRVEASVTKSLNQGDDVLAEMQRAQSELRELLQSTFYQQREKLRNGERK
jgi:hypothetical protein